MSNPSLCCGKLFCFSEVTLEDAIDAGGVDKWMAMEPTEADKLGETVREKRNRQKKTLEQVAGPEKAAQMRAANENKDRSISNQFPMLKSRSQIKMDREANVFNVLASRSI